MSWKDNKVVKFIQSPTISPQGFIVWGVTFVLIWAVTELFGMRSYATVISGNVPVSGLSEGRALLIGTMYVIVYFLAVLGSPILLIGAAILALLDRWLPTPKVPQSDSTI